MSSEGLCSLVGNINYDAFGAGGATGAGMLQYTGHERDGANAGPQTGSVRLPDYLHARNYDPLRGRFLSVDATSHSEPPATPQSWNRYAYARNSPLNRFDPDGLRDIYVAIWNRRFPYFGYGSVGHAAAFETDGN